MSERLETAGGRFDAEAPPIYFLPIDYSISSHILRRHPFALFPMNSMMQPDGERRLDELLESGAVILLDSGVFILANSFASKTDQEFWRVRQMPPAEIPGFEKLLARYVDVCRSYGSKIWGYVEFDLGDTETKRSTRTMLESEGLRPIPVFHAKSDPISYFDELVAGYDRICIGDLVQERSHVRKRILESLWRRLAILCGDRPYPWIHLLGYSPDELAISFPFHSADSSSYLRGAKWRIAHDAICCSSIKLPEEFSHTVGEEKEGDRGVALAWRLSAYLAHHRQRNWSAAVREFSDLGLIPRRGSAA